VNIFKRSLTATAFVALSATAAFAGDQYIDETGFAVSGYDVVAYFDLPQSAIGTPQVSDGHCAYGVAQGGKVPANPNLWRVVDGKLFLNITRNVVGFWEEDVPGNINSANGNWVNLEPTEASERTIPQFTSEAPDA